MSDCISLSFNLNHLKEAYISEIMRKTGWYDIVEFNMIVNSTTQYNEYSTFPIILSRISDNSDQFIINTPHTWRDPSQYFNVRLMISALNYTAQGYLIKKMNINSTVFEMEYPRNNYLYISVPYKSWFTEYLENIENNRVFTNNNESSTIVNTNENFDIDCDRGSESSCCFSDECSSEESSEYDSDDYKLSHNTPTNNNDLQDFNFRLNNVTYNSYILYRNNGSSKNDNSPWFLFPNYRPLYFSKKYNGYIVGLEMKEQLYNLGATFIDDSLFEEVD